MEYRQLGNSGLRVSALALGTMTFGGTGWAQPVGRTDVEGAKRQLHTCLDAGVNLVDTADVYSSGLSEEILGEAMTGLRDDVLVATKVRLAMSDEPNDTGLSRHHILRSCEASLRRLRVEHIDLYQMHEWDGQTPLEETLGALDDLVRSGKVRYVGVSNYAAWQLMKALGVSDRLHLPRFVSQQIHYTLQSRDAEYELIPTAIDQGLGVLIWGPLAGGLLSGKYRRDSGTPEGTRRFEGWEEPPIHDMDRLYDIIDVLVEVAHAHQVSAARIALAYILGKPAVTSVIIGARTDEQLADNLASLDVVLAADERERLDKASAMPLIYPHWHQVGDAFDRLSPADLSLLGPHLQ